MRLPGKFKGMERRAELPRVQWASWLHPAPGGAGRFPRLGHPGPQGSSAASPPVL